MVRLIRDLAVERHLPAVATLHQPRSSIWHDLDDVLLLAPGAMHVHVCTLLCAHYCVPTTVCTLCARCDCVLCVPCACHAHTMRVPRPMCMQAGASLSWGRPRLPSTTSAASATAARPSPTRPSF